MINSISSEVWNEKVKICPQAPSRLEMCIRDRLYYLLDRKQYRSVGYIGGLYEEGDLRIGYRRLEGLRETLSLIHI